MQEAADQHNVDDVKDDSISDDELKDIVPEGWTNAPSLMDLKADLEEAKPAHDIQTAKIKEWLDNLNISGSAAIKRVAGQSSVQPKLIRKQAEWRYAALSEPFLTTPDIFKIRPVTWEDKEAARQNSLVLNSQFNTKMDKVALVDEYVRAAVNEGTVITKLAWVSEEEEYEEEVPIMEFRENPEMAELHEELHALMENDPTGYKHEVPEELRMAHEASMEMGAPLEGNITGYETVKKTRMLKNHPVVEVCDYRNIIPDPTCGADFTNAKFIVHSYESSQAELQKAELYSNLKHTNAGDQSPLNDPDHDTEAAPDFVFKDKARKRKIVYEYWGYWDVKGNGELLPIVAAWIGNTLIRLEESPCPDKELPFVFTPTMPVKDSIYGEPDGELLKDNQKIIGAVTRGMVDLLGKSANGQIGSMKGALDPANKRKLETGQDYQYNGAIDPRMAFFQHTYPDIPVSAQWMIQHETIDAESMTGVKAFSEGLSSGALGDVATGIKGVLDSAAKRETGILRRLAGGMIKVGRKIIALNAELLDDEEIIRLTNENFVAVRRDDLKGYFDLSMEISTAEADNIKAQELAMMLQTLGPSTDFGLVKKVLIDIARLRKMPSLAEDLEQYAPQADPMDQEIKQLEIEKLKAEIEEISSRTVDNYAEAQLDEAKAGTEQAKANHLKSMSDKADLDFVEQESGVTQERNKEKLGTQAEANKGLKQFEHDLKMQDDTGTKLKEWLNGNNAK